MFIEFSPARQSHGCSAPRMNFFRSARRAVEFTISYPSRSLSMSQSSTSSIFGQSSRRMNVGFPFSWPKWSPCRFDGCSSRWRNAIPGTALPFASSNQTCLQGTGMVAEFGKPGMEIQVKSRESSTVLRHIRNKQPSGTRDGANMEAL
jgi:hypothetical protein